MIISCNYALHTSLLAIMCIKKNKKKNKLYFSVSLTEPDPPFATLQGVWLTISIDTIQNGYEI